MSHLKGKKEFLDATTEHNRYCPICHRKKAQHYGTKSEQARAIITHHPEITRLIILQYLERHMPALFRGPIKEPA